MKMNTERVLLLILITFALLLNGCTNETLSSKQVEIQSEKTTNNETSDQVGIQSDAQTEMKDEEVEIELKKEKDTYVIHTVNMGKSFQLLDNEDTLQLFDKEKKVIYQVDLENQKIQESNKSYLNDNIPLKSVKEVVAAARGIVVIVEDQGKYTLYHQLGESTRKIADDIVIEGNSIAYTISPDNSKIAFLDNKTDQLGIYNTKNQKLICIEEMVKEDFDGEFGERAIFSPKAGYITIVIKENMKPVGFKTFGADSSRLIHDLIYGVYPTWSNNEQYIAFLYKENNKTLQNITIGDEKMYLSDKIGMYNRKRNRVDYLDELKAPKYVMGPPEWGRDDKKLLFIGGDDTPSDIHFYNMASKVRTTVSEREMFESKNSGVICNLSISKNYLFYSYKENNRLIGFKVVNLNGKGEMIYKDVKPFILQEKSYDNLVNYTVFNNDDILFTKENHVYLGSDNSIKCILKCKDSIYKIEMLDKNKIMAIYTDGGKEQNIILMPLP